MLLPRASFQYRSTKVLQALSYVNTTSPGAAELTLPGPIPG